MDGVSERARFQADSVIGDRYVLRQPLGEGGGGWVWEAAHLFTRRRCAIKFLKRADEADRRRFEREVRASAAVRHPNVIDVHDVVALPDGTLAMVMELLEGETLATVLHREGALPLADIAAVLVDVTLAVEAAHDLGIVHRDLKPENIFLAREGSKTLVKVLDFGAAKVPADAFAERSEALTSTGAIVGTPYYMSPEQVFSEKDLDQRADIWSLGVVLYEALAGVRPTQADTVGQVLKRIMKASFLPVTEHVAALPADVADLVASMLSSDRASRPPTMKEVRAVLARHAEALPSVEKVDRPADLERRAESEHETSVVAVDPVRDALAYADTARADAPVGRNLAPSSHSHSCRGPPRLLRRCRFVGSSTRSPMARRSSSESRRSARPSC